MADASTARVVLAARGADALADRLAGALGATRGAATVRPFPDGETYVRVDAPVAGRDVILVAALRAPDAALTGLVLLADTARDLGARRIGVVAPYLPYMRQDERFRAGEGVTSRYVGRWLSAHVDWLVTLDPHLHRHARLTDVYQIPSSAISAAPAVADWIRTNVTDPVLVGPDAESAQWVGAVAARAGAPCLVLAKARRGDRDVDVVVPDDAGRWHGHTPVLVDDIVSTAETMCATVAALGRAGLPAPVCIAVHAVFADGAEAALAAAGAGRIVTCDTIPHPTNAIATLDLLVEGVQRHF